MRTLVTLLVLTTAVGVAHAKPVGKRAAAEAESHFQAGTQHYSAKEYDAAITEFEAGYALKPDPQILYNLGQSCRLGHHPECAIKYYRQYLAEVPDAPNKVTVEQRLAEVEAAQKAAEAPPPPAPTPAPAAAVTAPPPPVEHANLDLPKTPYQLGARLRYIFVTPQMMSSFLYSATGLSSVSAGIEFIYRKPTYDIVTSLDFSWLPVDEGNYLTAGHDPAIDTQFTQFRNLSFLSADVSLIGHHTWDAAPWFELRYGAGLGVGVVLGDVLLTHSAGCTITNASQHVDNLHDYSQCHPIGVGLGTPTQEADLKNTEVGGPYSKDTTGAPHRHVTSDKPPAMGVLNLVIGFRFKLPKKVTAQVEIGFRDAMFVGAGVHYLF